METISSFKKEVTWWMAILVFVVSGILSILTYYNSLDKRVSAVETSTKNFETFMVDHRKTTEIQNDSLSRVENNIELIMKYFRLQPVGDKE